MAELSTRWSLQERAGVHRALGDENRLRLVDCLVGSDRSPGELARLTGMPASLLAFHLGILEEAGVVERRRSEGDARRRYVRIRPEVTEMLGADAAGAGGGLVVFVCTHNSARSQFAEALWRWRAGGKAVSAGARPAEQVHPHAVRAGRRYGVDLTGMVPKGYAAVPAIADLVVSVCDRALESGIPIEGELVHWSVPDPVGRGEEAFDSAFDEIAERLGRMASRWS